jgi:hypothetical protein
VGDIIVPAFRPGRRTFGAHRVAVHPLENVVEDNPRAGNRKARAERHAERLGDRDDGAGGIRAGEMRGLLVHEVRGMALDDLSRQLPGIVALALADRGALAVDARALGRRVLLG